MSLAFPRNDISDDLLSAMFEEYFVDHDIPHVRKGGDFVFAEHFRLCLDSGYGGIYIDNINSRSYGHCLIHLKLRDGNNFDFYFQALVTRLKHLMEEE